MKGMSDDELARKITEAQGKMIGVHASTNNWDIINQFKAILETLETEQFERTQKKAWEYELKTQGVVSETEADLVEKKTAPTSKTKTTRATGVGSVFKRTKAPTNDT